MSRQGRLGWAVLVGSIAIVVIPGFVYLGFLVLSGFAFDGFEDDAPSFAGSATCAGCHQQEAALWRGSHHDRAMDVAAPHSVLGDFADARLEADGVVSTFHRRGDAFVVRTEGADGQPADFRVSHVFGVTPLQQYLAELPGGRLQALRQAWDARPKEQGGQRWFHLYPGERIPPGDELFWTGRSQNWNHMCAECHSTGLDKGYDLAKDAYRTTWAEIDVACEACHGPGSRHVAWAKRGGAGGGTRLVVQLRTSDPDAWFRPPAQATAQRRMPLASNAQVETCGRCHARRGVIARHYEHGRPLADTHRVALLDPGLYHADGQIRDEVYEYGSFLQSKMHARGVACADCHEPHSLQLLAAGNALCTRCHDAARFDTTEHLRHAPRKPGSLCVDCHMPVRTYMVVDPRRDHSFRVPRPDLTVAIGVPNACNDCHADRDARWAVAQVEAWYGKKERPPHYGLALDAGRRRRPGAASALRALAADLADPGIVRATALELLASYPEPATVAAARARLEDADPLVRAAAVGLLAGPAATAAVALLADPVRSVRLAAAQAMLEVPRDGLPPAARERLEDALRDCTEAELANADRPEAHVNLGRLLAGLGDVAAAEAAYRTALRLEPTSVVAHVDLADFYRQAGRESECEAVLRQGIAHQPQAAALHHALGLLLVRRRQPEAALAALGRAAQLSPEEPRFAYVHAIARHDGGDWQGALAALEAAHARHPADRDILVALTTIHRDRGHRDQARGFARRLVDLVPSDPDARRLLAELER